MDTCNVQTPVSLGMRTEMKAVQKMSAHNILSIQMGSVELLD